MARQVLFEHQTDSGQVIRIVMGDLTAEPVDAIVNAANERLAHGGGVAGAIVRQGGQVIQAESDEWVQTHGPVRTGTAAITSAGTLPAGHVVHAVGPVWGCSQRTGAGRRTRHPEHLLARHLVGHLRLPQETVRAGHDRHGHRLPGRKSSGCGARGQSVQHR